MATTEEDLRSFTEFVHERLNTVDRGLRLAELFDLWMIEHPDETAYAENVAAINGSIADFKNGERGTPAGEHSRQLRKELGIREE
ncbi:MAG: hypothetical protein WD070_03425 [Pirellulaceae bacterium]